MRLKGIFKEKSSASKLVVLFLIILVSVILHTSLGQVMIFLFTDISLIEVGMMKFTKQSEIDAVKFIQMFSSIGLFITPTLLYAYLCDFDLKLKLNFNRQTLILSIAIMLLISPFIAFIYEWNLSFNIPNWMLVFDNNAEKITKHFLKMNTTGDLFFNLLVMAIIPALGEELLFRGYLQQKICHWLDKPHFAIIITAILFSAIHMQFQGFLPRFVLGIVLGYLFYWSGSLWLPIIAHFLNNAIAVTFAYPAFSNYAYLTKNTATWQEAFFSFIAVILLAALLYKNLNIKKG
jgi:membrane protease YdiL (CAAX protease family)|tara:strand:- start:47 stop:919 length:873 start_codon:yes stop_codon:yes gene_type:complete